MAIKNPQLHELCSTAYQIIAPLWNSQLLGARLNPLTYLALVAADKKKAEEFEQRHKVPIKNLIGKVDATLASDARLHLCCAHRFGMASTIDIFLQVVLGYISPKVPQAVWDNTYGNLEKLVYETDPFKRKAYFRLYNADFGGSEKPVLA